ncbi:amidohydrolase family protein [bacterium]|nr:amidohydrolase family protein [bacterium]
MLTLRGGLCGLAALLLAACTREPPAPHTVFFGGSVHTGVDGEAVAEAVSVRDGRVVAVGTSESLVATAAPSTELIDLKGAHLYPGFTDAHAHLFGIGERELTLDLDEIASIADLQAAVAAAARPLAPGQLLVGRGWIETHWPEGRFPSRQDIDAVVADRPVILTRADGHALVANTRALEAAGLMAANPVQPEGGRIELDAGGLPTGMLIDRAQAPVRALQSTRDAAGIDEVYIKGAETYAARGWTGVHNMSVPPEHIARITALSDAGRLPLRIYNAVGVGADGMIDLSVMGRSAGGLVTTRAVKLYMDGALGSRGALLAAPYSDRPDTTGLQLAREAETLALLNQAKAGGVQVCFHAIGDRANTLVLDWMARTLGDDAPAARWRIEHAQILSAADIPRFASLGVIPSMQPSHAIGDLYFAPARLGPDRLAGTYAWRALIDAGAVIAGGSDAPVEQGDPRIEFYAASERRDLKGFQGADWDAGQAVSRAEALKMFTAWPAYAAFEDADFGVIEPGRVADFSVFSGDLLTLPAADILTVEPVMTVIGGAVAWRRGA